MAKFMRANKNNANNTRKELIYLNPLNEYNDQELIDRFRFPNTALKYITELVHNEIASESFRGTPIPPEIQVCAAVRFAVTGSFQRVIGDTLNISQTSVHRCVWKVVKALLKNIDQFIYMPTEQETRVIQQEFYSMARFPRVIGCIDGTHIRIIEPQLNPQSFINRKYYASINVMAICDSKNKFRYFYAKWPGSCHDSFILRSSEIWDAFENGSLHGIILGDSGYPCKNWLLTPFLNPESRPKQRYNSAHTRTRVTIERTFGIFKKRFASMHQELRLSPNDACLLICFCAILHNIAIDYHIEFNEPENNDDQPDSECNIDENACVTMREFIVQNHFT